MRNNLVLPQKLSAIGLASILTLFTFSLALFIFRVALLIAYGNGALALVPTADIIAWAKIGFLFDAKVQAIALFPGIVCYLCSIALRDRQYALERSAHVLIALGIMLNLFLSLVNHFYFRAFNGPIDIRIFGIVEDGFSKVFASVWKDYPFVELVIGLFFLTLVLFSLWRWSLSTFTRICAQTNMRLAITINVISFIVFTIAARGSVDTFPLGRDDLTASSVPFLNLASGNGTFAFMQAFMSAKKNAEAKHTTPQEGASLAGQLGYNVTHDFGINNLLQRTTAQSLDYKPNVVFILSESMSGYLLANPETHAFVAGKLADQLPSLLWFRNFSSFLNGTYPSLEFLLYGAVNSHVSDTMMQYTPLATAITKPFIENGYRTLFVTADQSGWHGLASSLPRQGFNSIIDQNTISQHFPEAKPATWGMSDVWMFKEIEKQLTEAQQQNQPVFIFALTTANHSPFEFPSDWNPPPFTIPESMKINLLVSPERWQVIIKGQRLANESLADFLTNLNHHIAGEHTIVAVTGDHGVREGLNYSKIEPFQTHLILV